MKSSTSFTPVSLLNDLDACFTAQKWVRQNKFISLDEAWLKCERGDWMLWFAAKRNIKRETLVLIACECARLALLFTKDPRVLKCIETAEAWTRGEATIERVCEARVAAYAAYAAAADDAYDAAYAAAAAYAAYAAAYAAGDDDAYDAYARKRILNECADIVRKHLPTLP